MGQNEHGAVVVLCQLTVQVGLQPFGRVAHYPLVVVVHHVVHFVDDKDTVMLGVVGTARRQRIPHHTVGVVIALQVDLVYVFAEGVIHVVLQSRQTRHGHFRVVHVVAGIVTQKQEAVGIRVARVSDGLYDPVHDGYAQSGILLGGLEIGSRQHVDGVVPVRDRREPLGRDLKRQYPDQYDTRQRKRQQLDSVRFQIHSPLISVDTNESLSLYTTHPASVKRGSPTSTGKCGKNPAPP